MRRFFFILLTLFLIVGVAFFMTYTGKKTPGIKVPPKKPTPVERTTELQVKSSIPYWEQEEALVSFREHVLKHDDLNLFWYYLGNNGEVVKYEYTVEDQGIIELAKENNVTTIATITNLPEEGGWDSGRVENMLSSKESRAKHIQNIIEKLNELDFDGINIDYEEVNASEKNRFSLFIEELKAELKKEDMVLSISLHPKTRNTEGLGGFQDWKQLSEYADQLSIMAFNEHWDESEAGPVASLPWVEDIITYSQYLDVPPEKIYLGIGLFGYDWNLDNDQAAEGLTYTDVIQLLNEHNVVGEWDSTYKSPHFTYEEEGDEHEVWYENANSIKEKVALAEDSGLGGVSFWRLGGEDPKIWEDL